MSPATQRTFEGDLEGRLAALEAEIDSGAHDEGGVVRPHEIWNTPGAAEPWGIVGEFARNRVVALTQEDFNQGTLRVLVPCKLILCESIRFNPNRPAPLLNGVDASGRDRQRIDRKRQLDWFPRPDQDAYVLTRRSSAHPVATTLAGFTPTFAYRLGFFAAITVEHGGGTILDLNGFSLSAHEEFAMQQRFHALIELANQPFVPGQGPAGFGPELRSARLVWIRNGELGRTSHHGIHGNQMRDVLISDVTFRDYEVAAISLNGGHRIVIRDCQLEGTSTNIPILGTYSTGRFLRLVGQQRLRRELVDLDTTLPGAQNEAQRCAIRSLGDILCQALEALDAVLDDAFDAAMYNSAEMPPLFENRERLADANPYGIALHARGVLVNAFLCNGSTFGGDDNDLARAYECSDVVLRRVNIARTQGNVRETLALAPRDGGAITDASGSLFRFFGVESPVLAADAPPDPQRPEMDPSNGMAQLSALGDAQVALAELEQALCDAGVVSEARRLTKMPAQVIRWARTDGWRILPSPGQPPHHWQVQDADGTSVLPLTLHANGDSMFHVNKGALGLFVQAVDSLTLDRVVVTVVRNVGLPGSDRAGAYGGAGDGGHPSQGKQLGYSGADARGIYVGACSNVDASGLVASGIRSDHGLAHGIEIAGGTERIRVSSAFVGPIRAGAAHRSADLKGGWPLVPRLPNQPPQAVGLRVDGSSRNVALADVQVAGPLLQPTPGEGVQVRIESPLVELER